MSEFKYACPVCGQHIKCDSSQAGTEMQCPTCFQKIIVPQPPTGEQNLILTGTKAGNGRPAPAAPESAPAVPPPQMGYSGAVIVFIILIFIAAAVAFVYQGTIFKRPAPPPKKSVTQKHPARQLIAPPANDTDWLLDLKGVSIPDSIAAGRINGQDFICQRATFSNGALTLRDGNMNFSVNLQDATPESLAGKTINVSTNAASAPRVVLRWKADERTIRKTFTNGYAMLLHFDNVTAKRIDGKIYLCAPDEKKSYVDGTFKAEIRKPRT